MKKANRRTVLLLVLPFILMTILDFTNKKYDVVDFYFDFNLTNLVEYLIMLGLAVILVLPILLWNGKLVYDTYMKRKKAVPLKLSRWLLFFTTLLTAYSFILFNLNYYYTALVVAILSLIYFVALKLFDRSFVRKSQKSKIDVNDELIMQLLLYLGGNDNVISVNFEYSRLKVELKDTTIVNLQAIQELGATGIFVAGNKLQAFVGTDAEKLERAIKQYLSH